MSRNPDTLTGVFLRECESLCRRIGNPRDPVPVDGKSLDLACILAVSRLCFPRNIWVDIAHRSIDTVLMSRQMKKLHSG